MENINKNKMHPTGILKKILSFLMVFIFFFDAQARLFDRSVKIMKEVFNIKNEDVVHERLTEAKRILDKLNRQQGITSIDVETLRFLDEVALDPDLLELKPALYSAAMRNISSNIESSKDEFFDSVIEKMRKSLKMRHDTFLLSTDFKLPPFKSDTKGYREEVFTYIRNTYFSVKGMDPDNAVPVGTSPVWEIPVEQHLREDMLIRQAIQARGGGLSPARTRRLEMLLRWWENHDFRFMVYDLITKNDLMDPKFLLEWWKKARLEVGDSRLEGYIKSSIRSIYEKYDVDGIWDHDDRFLQAVFSVINRSKGFGEEARPLIKEAMSEYKPLLD